MPESAIVPSRREELYATYLDAAHYVDAAIGELLATVRASVGREPAVIVVGDHGESLFDDAFLGHGYALNDPQTRIPLIAADIALDVQEPFGQSDVRDAVGRALSTGNPQGRPAARPLPGKRVFQYLGTLDRPRQIALTSGHDRVVYDFRSRKLCIDRTPCVISTSLDAKQQERFLNLVRRWESMLLARTASGGQDE